jgi:hypothetical protein
MPLAVREVGGEGVVTVSMVGREVNGGPQLSNGRHDSPGAMEQKRASKKGNRGVKRIRKESVSSRWFSGAQRQAVRIVSRSGLHGLYCSHRG